MTERHLRRGQWVGSALIVGAGLVTFWPVLRRLVEAWIGDGNYSHGFLIVPIAAYLAW